MSRHVALVPALHVTSPLQQLASALQATTSTSLGQAYNRAVITTSICFDLLPLATPCPPLPAPMK